MSKGKKAFVKPPAATAASSSTHPKSRSKGATWCVAVVVAVLAILVAGGIFLFRPALQQNQQQQQKQQLVPTYDELFNMSKIKNWTPFDPLDKLALSLERFSSIHDAGVLDAVSTSAGSRLESLDEFGVALTREVRFVLDVLKNDASRQFDLTEHLFSALRSARLSVYALMKASLSGAKLGDPARAQITSKLQAENKAALSKRPGGVGLYSTIQELLKLAPIRNGTLADGSSTFSRPHEHIDVDLWRAGGEEKTPVVPTVIRHRLQRILPVLVGIGASTEGALEAAIALGDDEAVALLLRLGSKSVSPEQAARSAEMWGADSSIAQRLQQGSTGAPAGKDIKSEAEAESWMLSFNSYSRVNFSASPSSSPSASTTASTEGGFVDTGLQLTGLLGPRTEAPTCDVSRVEALDLAKDDALLQQLAARGLPFVIRGDAFVEHLRSAWTLPLLRERARGRGGNVSLAAIPYADIYGLAVMSLDLASFLSPPEEAKAASGSASSKASSGVFKRVFSGRSSAGLTIRTHTDLVKAFLDKQSAKLSSASSASAAGAAAVASAGGGGGGGGAKGLSAMDVSDAEVASGLVGGGAVPPYLFSHKAPRIVKPEEAMLLGDGVARPVLAASPEEEEERKKKDNLVTPLRRVFRALQTGSPALAGQEPLPLPYTFQFYLGGPLSGSPFHSHQWAVNALVHGRKTWVLLPPARDVYSTLHPLAFASTGGVHRPDWPYKDMPPVTEAASTPASGAEAGGVRAGAGPCRVEQRAGEVLVVPRHWTHSVINLAETVGFAVEGV